MAAAEKYLNDIKTIDEKIIRKQQEIVMLQDKKEKSEAKLIGALMQDNNLTIDEVVELFQGGGTDSGTRSDNVNKTSKEDTNNG